MAEQCPYCGGEDFDYLDDGRYRCLSCRAIFSSPDYYEDEDIGGFDSNSDSEFTDIADYEGYEEELDDIMDVDEEYYYED